MNFNLLNELNSVLTISQNVSTNRTLPFDEKVIFAVLMLFYWLIVFIFAIILIDAELMTKKISLSILLITLVICGIILGGIPNAVRPIQQILTTISDRGDLIYLFQAILILFILLVSSYLVGRIFCGFACPLGTLQELLSKINFKSDLKSQSNNKYHINVSNKISLKIRWIFLLISISLATVFSIEILPLLNVLSGFSFFRDPTLLIVILGLIIVLFASMFIYRPWCRFLCPFGAGSAFLGKYSKNKYKRTEYCRDCGICEKICPTQEAFRDSKKGECYYCNRCIEVCPNNAIKLSLD